MDTKQALKYLLAAGAGYFAAKKFGNLNATISNQQFANKLVDWGIVPKGEVDQVIAEFDKLPEDLKKTLFNEMSNPESRDVFKAFWTHGSDPNFDPLYSSYSPEVLAFRVMTWIWLSGIIDNMISLNIPLTASSIVSNNTLDSFLSKLDHRIEESEDYFTKVNSESISLSRPTYKQISLQYGVMRNMVDKTIRLASPENVNVFMRSLDSDSSVTGMLPIYIKANNILLSNAPVADIFGAIERPPKISVCLSSPALYNALQLTGVVEITELPDEPEKVTATTHEEYSKRIVGDHPKAVHNDGNRCRTLKISKKAFSDTSNSFLNVQNDLVHLLKTSNISIDEYIDWEHGVTREFYYAA